MTFPLLGNSDHVIVSVSIDFPSNTQRDAPFYRITYDYSRADWDRFGDHLRVFHGRISLRCASAARQFCEWVQVGTDVYITYRKYQVTPLPSP